MYVLHAALHFPDSQHCHNSATAIDNIFIDIARETVIP
jgi:hypothetical protein